MVRPQAEQPFAKPERIAWKKTLMTSDSRNAARAALASAVSASNDRLIEHCASLVRARSENPPGDTREIAAVVAQFLRRVPGAEVEEPVLETPIVNVVARIKGFAPGRRLVFNGHLDTYPVGERSDWTVDPFGAEKRDGRMYGRGVADMKGGIACSLIAFELLASHRYAWRGELVLTFAGDEETMGDKGTAFLLDTIPYACGDTMICGDVGSPQVLRFGEKGFVWLDVEAEGKASHGAHVHKGINAIDRLLVAIGALQELRKHRVVPPEVVANAIRHASVKSESVSGVGETETLESITVNCGVIHGGVSPNLVPARACARFDIRLPAGLKADEIEVAIARKLAPLEGISYRVARRVDPTWTNPEHEVVRLLQQSGSEVLGATPIVNMRVGASDARLYRTRGLAAIVCGLTPYNLGGPDEYIVLDELCALAYMHTLTAFDYLSADSP